MQGPEGWAPVWLHGMPATGCRFGALHHTLQAAVLEPLTELTP